VQLGAFARSKTTGLASCFSSAASIFTHNNP
jgi:hypothetical protein